MSESNLTPEQQAMVDAMLKKYSEPARPTISPEAKALAQSLRERYAEAPQPAPAAPAPPGTPLDAARETAMTMGSGLLAEPAAGLAGLGVTMIEGLKGEPEALSRGAGAVEQMREAFTYMPRTQAGQEAVSRIGEYVGEPLAAVSEQFGQAGARLAGAPGYVTGRTFFDAALPIGLGTRPARALRNRREIARLEEAAREQGIDLRDPTVTQASGLIETAREMAPATKGEAMAPLRQEIINARNAAKLAVDDLYDIARGKPAAVTPDQSIFRTVNTALEGYDFENMPRLQKRLGEFRELVEGKPSESPIIVPGAQRQRATEVSLEELDKWRKRIRQNFPSGADAAPERAALSTLRDTVDQWVDAKFDADMISGDPGALDAWREARGAARDYKERFKDDRVVARFIAQEATPEEMRNWVFGASKTGFSPQAGQVVRRIKDIVGEDSPSFAALRDDAALQVIQPLLADRPNFRAFVKNYDELIRGNQSVVNAIFVPEQRRAMSELRDFAAALDKVDPTAPVRFDIPRALSTIAFGHGISRAGLKVKFAKDALRALTQAGGRQRQREIMGAISGYDPYQPMILRPQAALSGATAGAVRNAGEEEEEPQEE